MKYSYTQLSDEGKRQLLRDLTYELSDKKIAELESQVKSFVGATPSLGGTSEEASDDEDTSDKSITNFGASIMGRR